MVLILNISVTIFRFSVNFYSIFWRFSANNFPVPNNYTWSYPKLTCTEFWSISENRAIFQLYHNFEQEISLKHSSERLTITQGYERAWQRSIRGRDFLSFVGQTQPMCCEKYCTPGRKTLDWPFHGVLLRQKYARAWPDSEDQRICDWLHVPWGHARRFAHHGLFPKRFLPGNKVSPSIFGKAAGTDCQFCQRLMY